MPGESIFPGLLRDCPRCQAPAVVITKGLRRPAFCPACKIIATKQSWARAAQRYGQSQRGVLTRKRYRSSPKGVSTRRHYNATAPRRLYFNTWRKHSLRSLIYRSSDRNKEQRVIDDQRRRARKYATPVTTLARSEWRAILSRAKGRCYWCKKKCKRLTMDHVIPLCKGGLHVKENVVAACRPCNSAKGSRRITLF
jgi:5-methylcytosine-specific restriction endonuclease McrA